MSDSTAAPASTEPTLADELRRLNEQFWASTVHHAACDHDRLFIGMFGGLMALARVGDNGAPSVMALEILRESVKRATRATE